jgi:hypothetical protein
MKKQMMNDAGTWRGVMAREAIHLQRMGTEEESTQGAGGDKSDDCSMDNGSVMNQPTPILTSQMLATRKSRDGSLRN